MKKEKTFIRNLGEIIFLFGILGWGIHSLVNIYELFSEDKATNIMSNILSINVSIKLYAIETSNMLLGISLIVYSYIIEKEKAS